MTKFEKFSFVFLPIVILIGIIVHLSPSGDERVSDLKEKIKELEFDKTFSSTMYGALEEEANTYKDFLSVFTEIGMRYVSKGDEYYHRFEFYNLCEKTTLSTGGTFRIRSEEYFIDAGYRPCPDCEYYSKNSPDN